MDLKKLSEPFPASDVEWRMQTAGEKNGKVWARVLAYINNRAIMERLDDVCGAGSWRNEYRYEAGGAVLCGLSVLVNLPNGEYEWVTKWDGAENTDIEAVKGGLSNAMKRCGVQWGIGRYLYQLEEGFAVVRDGGENYVGKKDGKYPAFHWDPPKLPAWALPGGSGKPGKVSEAKVQAGAVTSDVTRDTQRQQSAPAVASPPAASESKADEDKKWKAKTLGERTDDELREIMEAVKNTGLHVALIDSCRRILAKRNPDAKLAKAIAEEHADQDTLQFR